MQIYFFKKHACYLGKVRLDTHTVKVRKKNSNFRYDVLLAYKVEGGNSYAIGNINELLQT
jgi:hypothetical protein